MNKFKLGRKPRAFNHKIPHMSALRLKSKVAPQFPPSVNYASPSISDYGMMLNDTLGDCTCAGFYHAIQIWSLNGEKSELTESDNSVLKLYENAAGYNPNDPNTDQGGVEQDILTYILKTGAPTDSGTPHKILAFYEVDPRNQNDVKQTIYECGVAYIGFEVPSSLMANGEPPAIWSDTSDSNIEGGHCVILTGFDAKGLDLISWGQKYRMTWGFFNTYVDEVYGIVDPLWIESTGQTPCGLTSAELEEAMAAIKEVPPSDSKV